MALPSLSPYARHLLKAYGCWLAGGLVGAHRYYLRDDLAAWGATAMFAFAVLLTGALVWIDLTTIRGATGDQVGPLGVLWLIIFGVALREGVRMPWIVRDAMDFGGLRPNARA